MLFRIVCECGHEGLVSSLPRRATCSACGDRRTFRVNDGDPVLVKLASTREQREADVDAFLRAYGHAEAAE
jgi:hypothetical protein